jgi:hypothetical protein
MSKEIVESILLGDYISANDLFEEKLSNIREKKMYEMKRMMQAETFGGRTRAQAEKEIRARGMTPRRASDVYPDPRDIKLAKMGEPKTDKKRKAAPKSVIRKPKDTRPGVIKRNVNTLMGRQAGYVKPEKSAAEKEMERGGRIGKGLRMAGKGVGKAWGLWSDVLRSGQSGNLEE